MPDLRLLIDTDTASDDAVALLLAARHPGATIDAVTTVAGNVPLDLATRNALLTLELAGAGGLPVHRGCDRPLLRPPETAQHVHGLDGMSDAPLPEPAGAATGEHAVDAILRMAREQDRKLTLVTLGPLTNLAAALVRDRGLFGRFRHTYCMAGAADACGNISPGAEFTAWADPEAGQLLIDRRRSAQPANLRLVRRVDTLGFEEMLLRACGEPIS